jgi:hypothetical protein
MSAETDLHGLFGTVVIPEVYAMAREHSAMVEALERIIHLEHHAGDGDCWRIARDVLEKAQRRREQRGEHVP